MEPNRELPPVDSVEHIKQTSDESEKLLINPENAVSSAANQKPAASQSAPPPAQQPLQYTAQSTPPAKPLQDDSLIADDSDLIEKEWVTKAKEIVEQTKNDPHLQSDEMSKFKAQYQKKRYNKDVKVSGG